MNRLISCTLGVVAVLAVGTVSQAQPRGPQFGQKLYVNPPSHFVQPPVQSQFQPQFRPQPGPGRLPADAAFVTSTRAIGFVGRIDRAGLRVDHVAPRSEARRAGLQGGDLIVRADRTRIDCEYDWVRAVDNARGQMCLTVRRPCGRHDQLYVNVSACDLHPGRGPIEYRNTHYAPQSFRHTTAIPQHRSFDGGTGYRIDVGNTGIRFGISF